MTVYEKKSPASTLKGKNTNGHETHTKLLNATVHFGPRAHEIVAQD